MTCKRRILITGSSGYLATQLIKKLLKNSAVEMVIGVDIQGPSVSSDKYTHIKMSVTDNRFVGKLMQKVFDTIIHMAWTFNPIHDTTKQDATDITGTSHILELSEQTKASVIYVGSSTCYGQLPENPLEAPFLQEDDWSNNAEKEKVCRIVMQETKLLWMKCFKNSVQSTEISMYLWFADQS